MTSRGEMAEKFSKKLEAHRKEQSVKRGKYAMIERRTRLTHSDHSKMNGLDPRVLGLLDEKPRVERKKVAKPKATTCTVDHKETPMKIRRRRNGETVEKVLNNVERVVHMVESIKDDTVRFMRGGKLLEAEPV